MEEPLCIAFLGTADFAVPTLRALAAGPDDIVGVFTRPDRPAGRGRRLRASPVKVAAQGLGLTVFQPERVSEADGLGILRELAPALVVVVAFGEVVSAEVLSVPTLGAVNLHASLLPRYRGAAPSQRALMAGATETGVTVQWMIEELDAGDIILQRAAAIEAEESFGSLHDRLAALGAEAAREGVALVRSMHRLRSMHRVREGRRPGRPQVHEEASQAPSIRRDELVVDWTKSAATVVNLVRAFSPRPGARTTDKRGLLKVLAAREGKNLLGERGIPGQIMELSDEGLVVAAGRGSVLVLRVQAAGGKAMSAADYLKGHRLRPGEQLGG